MSRRTELKQRAALLRGDIDRRADMAHQRIDSLVGRATRLAHSPAALPIAFVLGVLVERLGMPGIKNARELIATLAGNVNAEDIISGLVGASSR